MCNEQVGGFVMETKTLREVCCLVPVSRRAIQGYEQAGLVAPIGKNKYGYHLYNEEAIEKIKMIKQYQDFGFSMKTIKKLLEAQKEEYIVMMIERLTGMKKEVLELEMNIRKLQQIIMEEQQ